MLKRINIILIASVFVLSWCGPAKINENTNTTANTKKDYFISTQKISDLSKQVSIKKTWRLLWSQDILISAQASWKVSQIMVKEWQNVSKWTPLVNLSDTISSYEINLKRARNSLDSASLTYDTNKINLEKSINDAKIALEKAEKDYANAQKDINENLSKAQKDYSDSDVSVEKSQAKLNLDKTKSDLEKAKFDYDNLLKTNQQTISWYKNSLKVYYSNLNVLFDDVILLWDKVLWVTDKYKDYNDWFENYLWAKNTAKRNQAEAELAELIRLRTNYTSIDSSSLTNDQILQKLKYLESGYQKVDSFLDLFEWVLKDTVYSSVLPESWIDAYIWNINTYQATNNTYYSQTNAFYNSVESFLKTYQDQELSADKWVKLLEQQLAILEESLKSWTFNAQVWLTKTQIAWDSSLNAYEVWLRTAKNNYDNLLSTKNMTLQTLQNSIDQARIQYEDAQKEYDKLFITSPIDWKVWKIYVDKSQDIWIWSPIIQVVNDDKPEVNVSFNSNEIDYVKVWSLAKIDYNGISFTWFVSSVWNISDENMNYTVKVSLDKLLDKIWDFVSVEFPIVTDKIVLPINYSYIEWNWRWYIYVLSWESFQRVPISYWKVWLDKIEILSPLNPDYDMITTDLKNYDEKKFKIVIKN